MNLVSRRSVLGGLALMPAAPALSRAASPARVSIVGGGFGGASAARALKAARPDLTVTLITGEEVFHTCPFSNGVIGGLWPLDRIAFRHDGLRAAGVEVVHAEAAGIEPSTRSVTLAGGARIDSDFLVLAPGIQFDWAAIGNLSPEAAERMPHAWQAGLQTALLRRQLEAMDDGGLVVVAVPAPPFRCPPGPYERVCLIAHYLKAAKPKSKILVLDAQDSFSKQKLFEEAWENLYPGMVERVPGSMSGRVRAVDPGTMTVSTDFDDHKTSVANIIPPQKAAEAALAAGLDGGTGWCAVDPLTFESKLAKGVYVIGDSSLAGAMPKSGFSASMQGKVCAAAIMSRIAGIEPVPTKLINVCYSLAAPDYGFSIADVFIQKPDGIELVVKDGRTTALGAAQEVLRREADHARSWYDTLTAELFG
jgi:sulfide dehydrogenase [flavocytochrome c] flavoprotein subunit